MHDGAYQIDTEIADVDELDDLPVVGRVSTVELTVQIMWDSHWHRRTPDLADTACGVLLPRWHTTHYPTRREQLCDALQLCCTCFTEHERNKAGEEDARRQEAIEAENASFWAEVEKRKKKEQP